MASEWWIFNRYFIVAVKKFHFDYYWANMPVQTAILKPVT
jgi:hypothetical protein